MKRDYQKPTIKVYKLDNQPKLLNGSPTEGGGEGGSGYIQPTDLDVYKA